MAKASETTGAVADLIRLVSAVATSECYSIAGKMSELKAAVTTTETGETTAMAKAGGTTTAMDSHGRRRGGDGGVKGWRRGLYLNRRNVLFLSRRIKIFFERSKNNIDLH